MQNENYIVATIKSWNINIFNEIVKHYPGNWHLITDHKELTLEKIQSIDPKYIFFPHWSHIVPDEILEQSDCICFHGTDLPYGRGGSPVQNLIARGHRKSMITALKMSDELDAGPIYFKQEWSLEGLAEEIFIRGGYIIAEMIKRFITENPQPIPQTGEPTLFKRRRPRQSKVSLECSSLQELFDHIRMLDAEGYPKAFLKYGNLKLELTRPALKSDELIADVRITKA